MGKPIAANVECTSLVIKRVGTDDQRWSWACDCGLHCVQPLHTYVGALGDVAERHAQAKAGINV